MALSRAVKDERKDETQCINAPRYSLASMGAVERMNQTLAGQIRTLRLVLQARLGQRLPATSPVMPWVVRHAAWLITRFVVRLSGHTAYELLRGRAYRSELVDGREGVREETRRRPELEQDGLTMGERTLARQDRDLRRTYDQHSGVRCPEDASCATTNSL